MQEDNQRQKGKSFISYEDAMAFASQYTRAWVHKLFDYNDSDFNQIETDLPAENGKMKYRYVLKNGVKRKYIGYHVVYQP